MKSQKELFRDNPELRKAYAAKATRKSREKKRKAREQMSERSQKLQRENFKLMLRINSLNKEIEGYEALTTSNSKLIVQNHILSEKVKANNKLFNLLKIELSQNKNDQVLVNVKNLNFQKNMDRIKDIYFNKFSGSNWEEISINCSFLLKYKSFEKIRNGVLFGRVDNKNGRQRRVRLRIDINGVFGRKNKVKEAVWLKMIQLMSKSKSLLKQETNVKEEQNCMSENIFAASDPSKRVWFKAVEKKGREDCAFLCCEADLPSKEIRGHSVPVVFNSLISHDDLRRALIQQRLNKKSSKQRSTNIHKERILESLIIDKYNDKTNSSSLIFTFDYEFDDIEDTYSNSNEIFCLSKQQFNTYHQMDKQTYIRLVYKKIMSSIEETAKFIDNFLLHGTIRPS